MGGDSLFPPCPDEPGIHRNPAYPGLSGGCGSNAFDLPGYFSVFNATSAALKGIEPGISVGGPSTQQLGWVRELGEWCDQHHVGLDFIRWVRSHCTDGYSYTTMSDLRSSVCAVPT